MKYKRIDTLEEVEATKWYKLGDHANVSRLNLKKHICPKCDKPYLEHGRIDEENKKASWFEFVCPGDYIIEKQGEIHRVRPEIFQEYFEEVK